MGKQTHQSLNTIAMVSLLGIFLLVCCMLALASGQLFQTIDLRATEHDAVRVVRGYFTNQLRRYDYEGGVRLCSFGDGDALCLYTENGAYHTYIYCYEGEMMELFTDAESTYEPKYGTAVMNIESMEIARQEQTLVFTVQLEDGSTVSFRERLYSEVSDEE